MITGFAGPISLAPESIEHSIWGPIGAYVLLEQGKVTAEGDRLGFGDPYTASPSV